MVIMINKIDIILVFVNLVFGDGSSVGRRCPSQEKVTRKPVKIIPNLDTCCGGEG